nr:uncharacterized protein LOC117691037 [Crassostrea gigas]
MANTKYVFQVRGVYQDQEGSYGPANDDIQTPESLATKLLEYSNRIGKGNPSIHHLLATELQDSRNTTAKTRKLVLGDDRSRGGDEKTIMLVGATGSGKSTLVDGFVNYVMGVSFDDPFRFTLVQLEEEENKIHNQAVSQTEWITVYKIPHQKGGRLNYTLNIIDTPGFGDTRGIDRDQCTISQIRHLFSAEFPKGVHYIDAVCFIVKAPDARLTVSQKYIFSLIMALFGKDIESNICTLITFADGAEPPVLASLKEANLPFGSTFEFNNSALFAANKKLAPKSLSSMFWDMGCKSFQKFFDEICHFETRSLTQTKDVLKERKQLKTVFESIYPQVKAGLSKLSELRNQLDEFQRNRNDIENNKDIAYEVEETKQIKVELKPGEHVTNCLICNITCHERCEYADDDQKKNCCVMNNGYCTFCIKKCIWSEHKNTRYVFRYKTEKVRKTYTEMKEKYEQANGVRMTHQAFIEELTRDVNHLFLCVKQKMRELERCKSRLKVIALRPDPLYTVEHLDLMILAEEIEKQPGYEQRIKVLNEFRPMALIDKDFENFDEEIQLAKQEMASYGIESAKKEGIILERGFDYIKDFFSPYSSTTPNIQQKRNKKNKKKV